MSLARLARESAATSAVKAGVVAAPPPPPPVAPAPAAPAQQPNAFDLLSRYLPTETITLFMAALSARATLPAPLHDQLSAWVFYWGFAALTPVILLTLAYIAQRDAEAAGQMKAPFRPNLWPPVAAFIAFLAWALSVPGVLDPEVTKTWGAFVAFGALFVSNLLSLADHAFKVRKTS